MALIIREAVEHDADTMAVIEKECFSVPWSENAFANAIKSPDYIYIVAQEEQNIIGYAGCTITGDEGDITNIAVDKTWRGQGIGEKLLTELLNNVYNEGVMQIFLEVRESNIVAQSLYNKAGFEMIGIRKNFYQKPTENAILMKWNKI